MQLFWSYFYFVFRCSQFDDPLKKSGLDSDDQVSKTEHRKKRKNRYYEIQGSSTPATTRILRSMSKTGVTVLPCSSPELQNSEVANCQKHALVSPCDNDGSLDLSEPKNTSEMEHYGLLNSSEINFDTDGNNHSSKPEEWVWCFSLAFEMYATPFLFLFSSHLEEISYSSFFLSGHQNGLKVWCGRVIPIPTLQFGASIDIVFYRLSFW